MITRNDVLLRAADDCMKELYSLAQPHVEWDDFVSQTKLYVNQYLIWSKTKDTDPNYIGKSIVECIGPRPYEFYYLPREIMKEVCDSYVHSYKIDNQQELLDTIQILKNYCKKPIVDKYIDDWTDETGFHHPGYRSYDHPDNLEKEINTYLDLKFPLMDPERAEDAEDFENKLNTAAKELQDKFFKFLDMAGDFYSWNYELNSFNTSVYLGSSPCSNKKTVIDNWKQYRNKDIVIDESIYEENDDEF